MIFLCQVCYRRCEKGERGELCAINTIGLRKAGRSLACGIDPYFFSAN